ncbi:MAG TPA: FlgD immunoglobulin-like domain containing protein [Candidatus Krumholzibacteria bacterium]|nr:FlgD immunoglobulin-like domain containing protein [Candidatus Krumholzibacteria bacterium]
MVSQISQDLDAIHAAYPGWVEGVDDIHVKLDWLPGVIIVQMTAQAWADYQNNVFQEFNDLNDQYGLATTAPIALPYTLELDFVDLYNPVLLAAIYAQVPGITLAEPDFVYGDGSNITSTQVGTYTFKRGWDDCLSGCLYEHFWEFQVTNGNVTLLDEYGDPTLAGVGDTPPGAAALLVGNAPNPFDTGTEVAYRVESPTHIQLRIYDASGRLVKDLRNQSLSPGTYTATWDGTNDAGEQVASGVYFCRLAANGATQTRKLVMIR